ncbi:hypothetical protein [Citrobacter pasteurii]|nr:hypothetical protein SF123566_3966 [Shigella flexneri 1235-66]CEJ63819.1 hypothetical protein [Citrobacter pasteurii]
MFEIYARVTTLASLQDVGFTRLDAGVTTEAMSQKVRVFLAPRRTNPIAGFTPTACQHASTG